MTRMVVVLGAVALMLALIAGPVSAQAEATHYAVDEYFPNESASSVTTDIECGEYSGTYELSYHAKGSMTTVTKPNGEQVFFIHTLTLDGQAVNTETGTTLDLHGVHNEIQTDGGPYGGQYTYSQLLVSHDQKLRLFTSMIVRLDDNGEPVFENIQMHSNCPV